MSDKPPITIFDMQTLPLLFQIIKAMIPFLDFPMAKMLSVITEAIFMRTKEELPACPVATAVSLIGGKWKLLILRNLKVRPWRFNELQRDIDGIIAYSNLNAQL